MVFPALTIVFERLPDTVRLVRRQQSIQGAVRFFSGAKPDRGNLREAQPLRFGIEEE
jgi:hypothetical protein